MTTCLKRQGRDAHLRAQRNPELRKPVRPALGLREVVFVDVRRLAAVDMWGATGRLRRRALVRSEFVVGAIGCCILGGFVLWSGSGWQLPLGVWLLGAGVNYVPLAVYAQMLSRPGSLEAELEDLDLRRELRYAGVRQLWIALPFAVAIAATVGARPRRRD